MDTIYFCKCINKIIAYVDFQSFRRHFNADFRLQVSDGKSQLAGFALVLLVVCMHKLLYAFNKTIIQFMERYLNGQAFISAKRRVGKECVITCRYRCWRGY